MQELILYKEYVGESIIDLEEDIMFEINKLPKDENGFTIGTFLVKVEYIHD